MSEDIESTEGDANNCLQIVKEMRTALSTFGIDLDGMERRLKSIVARERARKPT